MRRRALDRDRWGQPDRNAAGEPLCRWCGHVITAPRRRTFCGESCVHEWRIRSSPSYVRDQVWARDEGICRRCGTSVKDAERAWKRQRPPKTDRAARRAWGGVAVSWHGYLDVPAERLVIAPDCGMKYLPREVAFGKMQAMAEGAALIRAELNR